MSASSRTLRPEELWEQSRSAISRGELENTIKLLKAWLSTAAEKAPAWQRHQAFFHLVESYNRQYRLDLAFPYMCELEIIESGESAGSIPRAHTGFIQGVSWSDALYIYAAQVESMDDVVALRGAYAKRLSGFASERHSEISVSLVNILSRLTEFQYYLGDYDAAKKYADECRVLLAHVIENASSHKFYNAEPIRNYILALSGLIKCAKQQHKEAVVDLTPAIAYLAAYSGCALYKKAIKARGVAYSKLGKHREALQDLEAADRLAHDQMTEEDCLALSQAHASLAGKESRAAAVKACKSAEQKNPRSLPVQYQKALLADDKAKPEALYKVIELAYELGIDKPGYVAIVEASARQLEKLVKGKPQAWLLELIYLRDFAQAYRHFSTPRLSDIDTACEKFGEHYGNILRGIYYLSESGINGASVSDIKQAQDCFRASIVAYARAKVDDIGCRLALSKLEEKCPLDALLYAPFVGMLYGSFADQEGGGKFFFEKACAAYTALSDEEALQVLRHKRVLQLRSQVEDVNRRYAGLPDRHQRYRNCEEDREKVKAMLGELEEHARLNANVNRVLAHCYEVLSRTLITEYDFYTSAFSVYVRIPDEAVVKNADRFRAERATLLRDEICRLAADSRRNEDTLKACRDLLSEFTKQCPAAYAAVIDCYDSLATHMQAKEGNLYQEAEATCRSNENALRDLKRRRGVRLYTMGCKIGRFGDKTEQKELYASAVQHYSYQAAMVLAKDEKEPAARLKLYQQALAFLCEQVGSGRPVPYAPPHAVLVKTMVDAIGFAIVSDRESYNKFVLDAVTFLFQVDHGAGDVLKTIIDNDAVKVLLRNAIKENHRDKGIYSAALLVNYLPGMTASQQHEVRAQLRPSAAGTPLAFHFDRALTMQPQRNELAKKFLVELCRDVDVPLDARLAVQADYYRRMRSHNDALELLALMCHQTENEVDLQTMIEALPARDDHLANLLRAELYTASALDKKDGDAEQAVRDADSAYFYYCKIFKSKDKSSHKDVDEKKLRQLEGAFPELAKKFRAAVEVITPADKKRREAEASAAAPSRAAGASEPTAPPAYEPLYPLLGQPLVGSAAAVAQSGSPVFTTPPAPAPAARAPVAASAPGSTGDLPPSYERATKKR